MEIILHINASFKCVFLLNGAFVEKAETVRYKSNESLYITVLPLDAQHLPYTVKLLGGKALSNEHLANIYTLQSDRFYVKLIPRFNYVYSTEHREAVTGTGIIETFFTNIRQGNLIKAREGLTQDLSSSIDDDSLKAFFDDYTDIVENKFSKSAPNSYYLIDKNNTGILFSFVLKGRQIDNIVQE